MVGEEYLPPTATRGAWALMSPAPVDPGSRMLKPEKKKDTRREEWVQTWRTSSPFLKDHVENIVIPEYPRKNQTRSRLPAAAQRLSATANVVRQNRPRGMRKRRWKGRRAPSPGCSVLRRTPRGIILVILRMMPAQRQISRQAGHIPPQILNLLMMHNKNHCREGQPPPSSRDTRAMVKESGWTVTGQVTHVMGGGEERGAPGKLQRDRVGDDRHSHEDIKKAARGQAGSGDHCHCHYVDFLIRSYPRVGNFALIQKIDKLDDTTSRILEDQAIFDNDLKTIRSHRGDYEAKLESMLVQQQRSVDNMIKYLETVENRMRGLEKRGGIPTPVPGPGPDLPRDPAPEWLLRRLTTLRTAAEGVAPMEGPMELAPYGPPRVERWLLRHIPPFLASVMLGEKTPEKGSGLVRPSGMPVRRLLRST